MTLGEQMQAAESDEVALPAIDAQEGTLGAQLYQEGDEEDYLEFEAKPGEAGDEDDSLEAPAAEAEATDPYALLPEEERQLLEWARSPVGSRMQAEATKLVEQFGGEEALLQALDTPQVDEAEIQARVREALAPVLSAVDEYGDLKYDVSDPLVQVLARQTADNIRAQTIQSLTQRQQAERVAQSRQESQVQSLLTQYPNAEPNALRVAAASGGDLTRAAQASHAHYTNLLTQTKAAAINAGHTRPTNRITQGAPAPLAPGGRAPAPAAIKMPDPVSDPKGFARFRQQVAEGKIRL